MRVMGLRAIYRRPGTSQPAPEHGVYPYLVRNTRVTRPNQVWAADITYLPMARGFLYLVAVMDWYSRYVVGWRLSNTLEAVFCIDALQEALEQGRPEVFNTDLGEPVHQRGVHPSPAGPWGEDQHGREGAVYRQHLRGAVVAYGEVRRGVSESLRQRHRGTEGSGSLLPVLQQPEAPSGLGLPGPAEVFHEARNATGDRSKLTEGLPEGVLVSLA